MYTSIRKLSRFLGCTVCAAFVASTARSAVITVTVDDTRYQTVTGFGAAACFGAMEPIREANCIRILYGPQSHVGLNIMRMEISPNLKGDITAADVGWDTPYDWHGYLTVAREAKARGAIIFGTPWSPPGEYKTNGTAQGGKGDAQGNKRGELRTDCYDKFFPWINSFLKYMKDNGVSIDAVSVQNEPDWWVAYSGCLYTPEQVHTLVKNYAHQLDREHYGVRLISAESLNFHPRYSDILLDDPDTRQHIDIIGGHLYGNPPLNYMATAARKAAQYGKEVWMTEHSVENEHQRDGLPTWHEELIFAEELNESMLAGATGYIYWYMRAHWAFLGTGEQKHMPGNEKNRLLRRGYVMSHFSKHVTGSTRLGTTASIATGTNSAFETSAYIKGDSLIVMAIDTTKNALDLKLQLPYKVKSGQHLLSTEDINCQFTDIAIAEPTETLVVPMPARSLNTYIFQIDRSPSAIELTADDSHLDVPAATYDLRGREVPSDCRGLVLRRQPDGRVVKVLQH